MGRSDYEVQKGSLVVGVFDFSFLSLFGRDAQWRNFDNNFRKVVL
jgi:hypothetical protein